MLYSLRPGVPLSPPHHPDWDFWTRRAAPGRAHIRIGETIRKVVDDAGDAPGAVVWARPSRGRPVRREPPRRQRAARSGRLTSATSMSTAGRTRVRPAP